MTAPGIAERVREILASRGFSMAKVSREAARLFSRLPRCRIPRNFYHDLLTTTLSPDIFQVFSLSAISGYGLTDWLALFGLPLEQIAALQVLLPTKRTALLDSTRYVTEMDVQWSVGVRWPADAICPLGRLLRATDIRPVPSNPQPEAEAYCYVKVGNEDAFAFPDLLAGSVVRIDKREPDRFLPLRNGQSSRALFLAEHAGGMVCCRLRRTDRKRVTLHTSELPYAEVPLELDREVRIQGVVDLEIRRLTRLESPKVPAALASFWKPGFLVSPERNIGMGNWIRMSRLRSGLHFREASAQTARIARVLRDSRYFIACGSLSDYETTNRPPRHIQKILSLCVIYSLRFQAFLEKTGLPLERSGRAPLPEQWLPRPILSFPLPDMAARSARLPKAISLQSLLGQIRDLPHFLAGALPEVTGLAAPAVRDVFWLDGNRVSFHPYLRGALFIIVDRRIKRPRPVVHAAMSDQPLYLFLRRDGNYLCGRCSIEGNDLVVHPFSNGLLEPVRFRNRVDAEIVGQIVTVVRRISPGT